jgi:hypothetical protein
MSRTRPRDGSSSLRSITTVDSVDTVQACLDLAGAWGWW